MEFEKIAALIAGQLSVNVSEVRPDSRFAEDLRADSLDLVSLVMELERVYNVELPDDKLIEIKTVADILRFMGIEATE